MVPLDGPFELSSAVTFRAENIYCFVLRRLLAINVDELIIYAFFGLDNKFSVILVGLFMDTDSR